jgi:hypothetical protein
MTHIKFWVVEEDDDEIEEEIKYSNILQEEEYEDEEDPPQGFAGTQTGSNIIEEEQSDHTTGPVPWDPSQPHFLFTYNTNGIHCYGSCDDH